MFIFLTSELCYTTASTGDTGQKHITTALINNTSKISSQESQTDSFEEKETSVNLQSNRVWICVLTGYWPWAEEIIRY